MSGRNIIPSPINGAESGDVWLFSRKGLFNRIIQIKTWSRVSHTEVVDIDERCRLRMVASRNGVGCGIYEPDLNGIAMVLRPQLPFSRNRAMAWFVANQIDEQGYDFLGLSAFFYAKARGAGNKAQFCSELVARYLRAGGFDPCRETDADTIAPRDFLICPLLRPVWRSEEEWNRWFVENAEGTAY